MKIPITFLAWLLGFFLIQIRATTMIEYVQVAKKLSHFERNVIRIPIEEGDFKDNSNKIDNIAFLKSLFCSLSNPLIGEQVNYQAPLIPSPKLLGILVKKIEDSCPLSFHELLPYYIRQLEAYTKEGRKNDQLFTLLSKKKVTLYTLDKLLKGALGLEGMRDTSSKKSNHFSKDQEEEWNRRIQEIEVSEKGTFSQKETLIFLSIMMTL